MTLIKSVEQSEEQAEIAPSQETSLPLSQENRRSWSFWAVFSSTFLTIFFAEMGDKTQLATLLISAESQSPWIVFAGAAAALIATSLLGVMVGYWLAKRLSPKVLDFSVAILMLIVSGLLLGDVVTSYQ